MERPVPSWAQRMEFARERLQAGDAPATARAAVMTRFGVSKRTAARSTRVAVELEGRRLWKSARKAEAVGDHTGAGRALVDYAILYGILPPSARDEDG